MEVQAPGMTESTVSVTLPSTRTCGRNAARLRFSPLVAGAGPLKMPVVAPSVGSAAVGSSVLPSAARRVGAFSTPVTSWPDGARGVVTLVARADSRDDGPDLTLFT